MIFHLVVTGCCFRNETDVEIYYKNLETQNEQMCIYSRHMLTDNEQYKKRGRYGKRRNRIKNNI